MYIVGLYVCANRSCLLIAITNRKVNKRNYSAATSKIIEEFATRGIYQYIHKFEYTSNSGTYQINDNAERDYQTAKVRDHYCLESGSCLECRIWKERLVEYGRSDW